MPILAMLIFLWRTASLADFTRFYPNEKLFLQEALYSSHLLLVDDQVSGLCWTNVVEAPEEIGVLWGT